MIDATSAFRSAIVGKTRRIYLKAVVDISDPDMTIGAVTSSGLAPWSKSAQLTDKDISAPPRYATLEKNRWLRWIVCGFPRRLSNCGRNWDGK